MSKVDLYYQEDSVGDAMMEKRVMTAEEEKLMEEVLKTLESPGYKVLHSIMVEKLTIAEKALWDKYTPVDEMRHCQGIIHAIQTIQNKFLSLSKEEGYGNT